MAGDEALILDDEALIQKFIGLHTNDGAVPTLDVPTNATSSTKWDQCLLLRVITDKQVVDK